MAPLLFLLEKRQKPEGLAEVIQSVIGWFRSHPGYDEVRRLFTELIGKAISGVGQQTVTMPEDLEEMKTVLETLGEVWKEEWKAEGLPAWRAE